MTFDTINQCLGGNTDSIKLTRNRDIMVVNKGDTFPTMKVTDFTIAVNGQLILIVEPA